MNAVSTMDVFSELMSCPVCLSKYSNGNAYKNAPVTISCGHSLCYACILMMPYIECEPNSKQCPICRSKFSLNFLAVSFSLSVVIKQLGKAIWISEKRPTKNNVTRKLLEGLEETLSCPVCRVSYSDEPKHENNPATLICGYSLCVSCFGKLKIDHSEFPRKGKKCPSCARLTSAEQPPAVNYKMFEVIEAKENVHQKLKEEEKEAEESRILYDLFNEKKNPARRRIPVQSVHFSSAKRRNDYGYQPQLMQPPRRSGNNRKTRSV